jgi:hypothetical protein
MTAGSGPTPPLQARSAASDRQLGPTRPGPGQPPNHRANQRSRPGASRVVSGGTGSPGRRPVRVAQAARRRKHSLVIAVTMRNEAVAVDRQMVAQTVSQLQTTLPQADDLLAGLQRVAEATRTVLEVDGAGLTLVHEDGLPRWVAATDAALELLEQIQHDFGEGPTSRRMPRTGRWGPWMCTAPSRGARTAHELRRWASSRRWPASWSRPVCSWPAGSWRSPSCSRR